MKDVRSFTTIRSRADLGDTIKPRREWLRSQSDKSYPLDTTLSRPAGSAAGAVDVPLVLLPVQLQDQRVLERIAASEKLQTLTDSELQLTREPMTRDPQTKPAKAWVRFGTTPVTVDAEVCAWTSSAVAIRFTIAGREYKTWVWASAVTPTDRPTL